MVVVSCLTLKTPQTVARQAPLSMGVSRQEYWSGLPFPSPGDLPDPRTKPQSAALQANSLPTEPPVLFKYLLPFTRVRDYIWIGQKVHSGLSEKTQQTWPTQYSPVPFTWTVISDSLILFLSLPFSLSLSPTSRGCSITPAHHEHGMEQ